MNGYCEMVTGTLGGGKTLFETERGYAHIARGGHVYSNIEFDHEAWARTLRDRDGLRFDPSRLVTLSGEETLKFHKHIPRGTHQSAVRVVIDEAGLDFNSRDHASCDRDLLATATLARKLDVILVFISQQATDMFKQFRGKCRTEWQCRNLFNRRIFGVVEMRIPLFFRVAYDITRGKREYLCHDVVPAPTWVYPLYRSDSLVGRGREAVAGMRQVEATPLEKIERPDAAGFRGKLIYAGATACAFGAGLSLVS